MSSHTQQWNEARRAIDRLIARFFAAVSFEPGQPPRYETLHELFIDGGVLFNGAAPQAVASSVAGFVETRRAAHEKSRGEISHYRASALSETTEIFGRVAHRSCLFLRAGTRQGQPFENRGAIFFQLVRLEGQWRISAAAWDDRQPGQPLSTQPEFDEFG